LPAEAGVVLPVATGSSLLGSAIAPPETVNASTATRATTRAADDPFIGIPSVDAIPKFNAKVCGIVPASGASRQGRILQRIV
jgi:hypothetical protein